MESLFTRINTTRNKLSIQKWRPEDWIVVSPAGGTYPCAMFFSGRDFAWQETIIDQTLYWCKVLTKREATYIAGMLNSEAGHSAIRARQPRGAFGERHIHKLLFVHTPRYERGNKSHEKVISATRALLKDWSNEKLTAKLDQWLDPNSNLGIRRRKIRRALRSLPSWKAYELATKSVYK